MEFSDPIEHGNASSRTKAREAKGGPVAVSPDGTVLAHTDNKGEFNLELRDIQSLKVLQTYKCQDAVQHLEWSPDSKYIVSGMYKRGLVQLHSVEHKDWHCKIDPGTEGVEHVRWSPDSRHVIITAEFQLQITVWSLVDRSCVAIPFPKFSNKGIAFTADGHHMAVAHRQEAKDVVRIYSCTSWEMVSEFIAATSDLADLCWSPNGTMLAVWDTELSYNVLVYSIDGRQLESYSAYDNALGVKRVEWSPSSQVPPPRALPPRP